MDRCVPAAALELVIHGVLERCGCAQDEAREVSTHLVEASLRGHDSHGVIRIMRYVQWLENGQIHANRELRILSDGGALLHLDGQSGMGQRLARDAIRLGIERAADHGTAIVALRRAGHVGRLGSYAEQACAAGLVSIHFCNVAGSRIVAPFGGAEARMSTAPMAVGVPNAKGEDFILDFATSLVAEGKALVAARGGKPLPDGALIDGEGRRTSDPAALYGDSLHTDVPNPRAGAGALRAMGDHKGSGLALACELLAGALTGNGVNGATEAPFGNGVLSILTDPARLDDGGGFGAEVAAYLDYVQSAQPEAGADRVRVPGEPERERRRERLEKGIPVPEAVADGIAALAERHGVDAGGLRT